jgi:hypothetical protein
MRPQRPGRLTYKEAHAVTLVGARRDPSGLTTRMGGRSTLTRPMAPRHPRFIGGPRPRRAERPDRLVLTATDVRGSATGPAHDRSDTTTTRAAELAVMAFGSTPSRPRLVLASASGTSPTSRTATQPLRCVSAARDRYEIHRGPGYIGRPQLRRPSDPSAARRVDCWPRPYHQATDGCSAPTISPSSSRRRGGAVSPPSITCEPSHGCPSPDRGRSRASHIHRPRAHRPRRAGSRGVHFVAKNHA